MDADHQNVEGFSKKFRRIKPWQDIQVQSADCAEEKVQNFFLRETDATQISAPMRGGHMHLVNMEGVGRSPATTRYSSGKSRKSKGCMVY